MSKATSGCAIGVFSILLVGGTVSLSGVDRASAQTATSGTPIGIPMLPSKGPTQTPASGQQVASQNPAAGAMQPPAVQTAAPATPKPVGSLLSPVAEAPPDAVAAPPATATASAPSGAPSAAVSDDSGVPDSAQEDAGAPVPPGVNPGMPVNQLIYYNTQVQRLTYESTIARLKSEIATSQDEIAKAQAEIKKAGSGKSDDDQDDQYQAIPQAPQPVAPAAAPAAPVPSVLAIFGGVYGMTAELSTPTGTIQAKAGEDIGNGQTVKSVTSSGVVLDDNGHQDFLRFGGAGGSTGSGSNAAVPGTPQNPIPLQAQRIDVPAPPSLVPPSTSNGGVNLP